MRVNFLNFQGIFLRILFLWKFDCGYENSFHTLSFIANSRATGEWGENS